jgi:hypothetical protein
MSDAGAGPAYTPMSPGDAGVQPDWVAGLMLSREAAALAVDLQAAIGAGGEGVE